MIFKNIQPRTFDALIAQSGYTKIKVKHSTPIDTDISSRVAWVKTAGAEKAEAVRSIFAYEGDNVITVPGLTQGVSYDMSCALVDDFAMSDLDVLQAQYEDAATIIDVYTSPVITTKTPAHIAAVININDDQTQIGTPATTVRITFAGEADIAVVEASDDNWATKTTVFTGYVSDGDVVDTTMASGTYKLRVRSTINFFDGSTETATPVVYGSDVSVADSIAPPANLSSLSLSAVKVLDTVSSYNLLVSWDWSIASGGQKQNSVVSYIEFDGNITDLSTLNWDTAHTEVVLATDVRFVAVPYRKHLAIRVQVQGWNNNTSDAEYSRIFVSEVTSDSGVVGYAVPTTGQDLADNTNIILDSKHLSGFDSVGNKTFNFDAATGNVTIGRAGTYGGGSVATPFQFDAVNNLLSVSGQVITDSIVSADFVMGDLDGARPQFRTASKSEYASAASGIWMGYSEGLFKLNIGDANQFIRWDGNDLEISGDVRITGGSTLGQSQKTVTIYKVYLDGESTAVPTGGTYDNPISTNAASLGWLSYSPEFDSTTSSVYSSTRIFTTDGFAPQEDVWSPVGLYTTGGGTGAPAPYIALTASAQSFLTDVDSSVSPSSITFSVVSANLEGSLVWTTSPSTTLTGTGNTRTLTAANFGASSNVTVTVSDGNVSDSINIIAIQDGGKGDTGERGAGRFTTAYDGEFPNTWSNTASAGLLAALAAAPTGYPVEDDVVTIYQLNNASKQFTLTYSSGAFSSQSSWNTFALEVHGDALVDGTVQANTLIAIDDETGYSVTINDSDTLIRARGSEYNPDSGNNEIIDIFRIDKSSAGEEHSSGKLHGAIINDRTIYSKSFSQEAIDYVSNLIGATTNSGALKTFTGSVSMTSPNPQAVLGEFIHAEGTPIAIKASISAYNMEQYVNGVGAPSGVTPPDAKIYIYRRLSSQTATSNVLVATKIVNGTTKIVSDNGEWEEFFTIEVSESLNGSLSTTDDPIAGAYIYSAWVRLIATANIPLTHCVLTVSTDEPVVNAGVDFTGYPRVDADTTWTGDNEFTNTVEAPSFKGNLIGNAATATSASTATTATTASTATTATTAGTATTLKTARNINGVLFNGSSDITIYDSTKLATAGGVLTGNVRWNDSIEARFGNDSDFRIMHNNSHAYLSNYTGNIYLRNEFNSGDIYIQSKNSSGTRYNGIAVIAGTDVYTRLSYNGSIRLDTTSTGVDVTGTVKATTFEGALSGNAATATTADKWDNARTLTTTLTGDVTGTASMSVDGTASKTTTITTVVGNDSHTHAFNNLTGKSSGTGDYYTTGALVSGNGSGGVALTVNDGFGNANVTFNHRAGNPEQTGNAARIEVNTDTTTNASMYFELKSGVTKDVAVQTATIMTLTESGITGSVPFIGSLTGNASSASLLDGYAHSAFGKLTSTNSWTGQNTYSGKSQFNVNTSAEFQITATDTSANSNFSAAFIDHNISGSTTLTTDRTHRGLQIDVDSSATGGDTSNEHRVYGIESNVKVSGDSDLVYGTYNYVETEHSSGTVSNLRGIDNYVVADVRSGGTIVQAHGVYNNCYRPSSATGTVNNMYGSENRVVINGATTTALAIGVRAEVELDAGTLTTAKAVDAVIDRDGGTITTGYLFFGDYQGTWPTNAWGIYIADTVTNYFAGDVTSGGYLREKSQLISERYLGIADLNYDDSASYAAAWEAVEQFKDWSTSGSADTSGYTLVTESIATGFVNSIIGQFNVVVAASANIGTLSAGAINVDDLFAQTILATGSITAGTGNDIGVLSGSDSTWRIYAGHTTPSSAPFRVDKDGKLVASNADISGTIRVGGTALTKANTLNDNGLGNYNLLPDAGFEVPFVDGLSAAFPNTGGSIAGTSASYRVPSDDEGWALTFEGVTGSVSEGAFADESKYWDVTSDYYSVSPGDKVCASAYTGAHRCSVQIYVRFVDVNGAYVSYAGFASNNEEKGGGRELSGYKRLVTIAEAPAGASAVRISLRKYGTKSGSTSSYMFYVKPQLSILGPDQTEAPTWVDNKASKSLAANTGSIAGWTINDSAIYTGTLTTSGYSSSGVTLNSAGSIHAKQFYIDSSGNSFFKGSIIGGTITGGTITGSSIETAPFRDTSASRVTLNPQGLAYWDEGTNGSAVTIGSRNEGTITMYDEFNLTSNTLLLLKGNGAEATNTSEYLGRVENTVPTRGWYGNGLLFSVLYGHALRCTSTGPAPTVQIESSIHSGTGLSVTRSLATPNGAPEAAAIYAVGGGAPALNAVTNTGVPPLKVNSNTVVTNLNADMLDGSHASAFVKQGADYIKFGPGTPANDDAHIEWGGASNAGYLRISTSDDNGVEPVEFGDYDTTNRGGTFTRWANMWRNNTYFSGSSPQVVIQCTSTNSARLYLNNTEGGARLHSDNGSFTISQTDKDLGSTETWAYFAQNGSVDLYHNNIKKFETTSVGATVLGTLTATGSSANIYSINTLAGSANLHLRNTEGGARFYSDTGNLYMRQTSSTGGDEDYWIYCRKNSSVYLYYNGSSKLYTQNTGVYVSGTLTASTDVTISSDRRLKDNIVTIPNALDKVNKLGGYTYTRKDLEDKEERHTGVIAQEVLEVLPEAVRGTGSEEDPYSVAYGNMVGLLIESIKELKAEVEELKGRVS